MMLTLQQQNAISAINSFIDDKCCSVFILKGYAGTGKTTIVKSIIPLLEDKGKHVTLMAPTGRAAKVLGDKTKRKACTIHHGIYSFQNMKLTSRGEMELYDDIDRNNNDGDKLNYWFRIKEHDSCYVPSDNVYIIDESSMICSRYSASENFHFGTDVLLDDLLTYIRTDIGGKVIFVGDPAQLPPVGDNRSAALDESFFSSLNIGVKSFELTEVLRQKGESVILKNAMMIRNLLDSPINERNNLNFVRKAGEVEDIVPMDIPQMYCRMYPEPSIGDTIVVSYTNSKVKDYNDAIRRNYFPGKTDVAVGDILMVVKNIINTNLGLEYFNGDFVKVLKVSDNVEKQSAAVWTNGNNKKRERVTVSLYYRDVTLLSEDGTECSCKIIDNLLNSRDAALTPLQTTAAYINFIMRHNKLNPKTDEFTASLMKDPYFNAIQVKYGYAITGHKSQGGEWDTVFLDYSGRTGLNNESLRWNYTATTRARNSIYGVDMPSITPISSLVFKEVQKLSKPSKEAFSYADVQGLEDIMPGAKAFQIQKYISVKSNLDRLGYVISAVRLLNYNDQYVIDTPEHSILYSCFYNASCMYTRYFTDSGADECKVIEDAFNDESDMEFNVDYTPSSDVLRQLYNKVMSLCDDLGITVTNIVEYTDRYYVMYCFKTTARFAQIKFYYKSNGAFSYILPGSELGDKDMLLVELINALK